MKKRILSFFFVYLIFFRIEINKFSFLNKQQQETKSSYQLGSLDFKWAASWLRWGMLLYMTNRYINTGNMILPISIANIKSEYINYGSIIWIMHWT